MAIKPKPSSCATVSLVSVVDGDTAVIKNESSVTEKVRISQIDAPERSQSFGSSATSCLKNLLSNASLSVCRDGTDKYGRTIASINSNGVDVATLMVSQGCAWAYTKYLEANSNLPTLQAEAKAANRGLWATGTAQTPWEYRAGTAPVTVNPTTKQTAISTSSSTTATVRDRVFDWAEQKYNDLLINGTDTAMTPEGIYYRCYSGGPCIGYRNGRFLFYDGRVISDVGSEDQLLPSAAADGF